MKRLLPIIFAVSVLSAYAQDAVTDTMRYVDNFSSSDVGINIIRGVLPKSERINSNQGSIKFHIAENVPDSIETAVRVAGDIWQQYLDGKTSAEIGIEYVNLDNDIETEIVYFSHNDNPEINYPSCLYKYLFPFEADNYSDDSSIPKIDAKIYINSNASWDCTFSTDANVSTNNMTYAIMRAIANALGFGSSVTEYVRRGESRIYFNLTDGHSVFDNLIFSSDGKRMRDIPNLGRNIENTLLREFIQPIGNTEIYALLQSPSYRMYAPPVFEPYKSLVYLNNTNSLMHYDLNKGNKVHQVDDVTINLLREIGWYSQGDTLVNIVSNDIGDSGIASAYSSHSFTVENLSSGTIANARWEYRLPLASGGDSLMLSATNTLSFEIPAVSDENLFVRNVNGDIYGRIIFSGEIDGIAVEDVYTVSLELKPRIQYVTDIRKVNKFSNNYYDLYFTVCYTGDNSLTVVKEEDGDSFLRTQYVYEPFLAHVKVENVSYDYWAWVDITVKNDYGKDVYTIELPAETGYYLASVTAEKADDNSLLIDVYDISGKQVMEHVDENVLTHLSKGIYILKYICPDGSSSKTEKFIKN